MSEELTLECENCGWTGDPSELHCSDEDWDSDKATEDIKFNRCPDCGSTEVVDLETGKKLK